jgi:hypothetical protein
MASELGWQLAMPGAEGPLTEFAALRHEIDSRGKVQSNLLTLQLTISGAVFSFALTDPSRRAFLLLLPFSTYMLCGRFATQHAGIMLLAAYIRDSLSHRVPGGLQWEQWRLHNRQTDLPAIGWIAPLFINFPAVALMALAWVSPQVFVVDWSFEVVGHLGLIGTWLLGLIATGTSIWLVWEIRRWHWAAISRPGRPVAPSP